jgi:hypothetical protein
VLSSLIRITTHPRIYRSPSALDEAFSFCNAILEAPNATVITPQERHWSIFQKLSAECRATGNLIPDAWLAALAIEAGCEWITTEISRASEGCDAGVPSSCDPSVLLPEGAAF